MNGQMDEQIYRQTDRQTNRKTDGLSNRQGKQFCLHQWKMTIALNWIHLVTFLQNFPWKPKPLSVLDEMTISFVSEEACLIYFTGWWKWPCLIMIYRWFSDIVTFRRKFTSCWQCCVSVIFGWFSWTLAHPCPWLLQSP